MRCPHCNAPCRWIGEQRGAEKYYGCRMELWTCMGCGTTLSNMQPLATIQVSQVVPAEPPRQGAQQQERTLGE